MHMKHLFGWIEIRVHFVDEALIDYDFIRNLYQKLPIQKVPPILIRLVDINKRLALQYLNYVPHIIRGQKLLLKVFQVAKHKLIEERPLFCH